MQDVVLFFIGIAAIPLAIYASNLAEQMQAIEDKAIRCELDRIHDRLKERANTGTTTRLYEVEP